MTIHRNDFPIDIYGRGRGGGGRGGGRGRGRGPGATAVAAMQRAGGRDRGGAGGMQSQLGAGPTGLEWMQEEPAPVGAPEDFEAMIERIAQQIGGEELAGSGAFGAMHEDHDDYDESDDEEYGLLIGAEAFNLTPGPISRSDLTESYGAHPSSCPCPKPRYGVNDDGDWASDGRRPGTFGESLKIGAGLGVGFLGVALVAGAIAKSFS